MKSFGFGIAGEACSAMARCRVRFGIALAKKREGLMRTQDVLEFLDEQRARNSFRKKKSGHPSSTAKRNGGPFYVWKSSRHGCVGLPLAAGRRLVSRENGSRRHSPGILNGSESELR